MPGNAPTGYDEPEFVKDLPRTYPPHKLESAQDEYYSARGPMISKAAFYRKHPGHKSLVKADHKRFAKAQKALIYARAQHEGKTMREVQTEFTKNAEKAHAAASKIQKAYKTRRGNSGGSHRRGRKSRSTRRR